MGNAIQSVSRCFAALRALNRDNGASLKNIAENIDLPRGTVYRLLETLIGEGYVRKDPYTGGYWLQHQVWDLVAGYKDQEWILDGTTASVIKDLYSEVQWCLSLSTPLHSSMVIRVATERRHPEGLRTIAGIRAPMLKFGAGYTYLAYCDPNERESLLDKIFLDETVDHDHSTGDGVTRSGVISELNRIRTTGYCVRTSGQRSRQLSVPVFHDGAAAAALSMTYFASVVSPSDIASNFAPRLLRAAEAISHR